MDQNLSPEVLLAHLTGPLRHWRLADGELVRCYRTSGWKGTLMAAGAIGHLAEIAWHHPTLVLSYDRVEVRLITHLSQGITDKDLALAHKIEAVVHWRPSAEGGALTGIPEGDPGLAYIRYDD